MPRNLRVPPFDFVPSICFHAKKKNVLLRALKTDFETVTTTNNTTNIDYRLIRQIGNCFFGRQFASDVKARHKNIKYLFIQKSDKVQYTLDNKNSTSYRFDQLTGEHNYISNASPLFTLAMHSS